jgi:hypothetical protein
MRTTTTGLILAACVALGANPLAAQRQASRPGMWLGGGLGLGWARVNCRICGANRGHSLSAYAHVGGRISNQVLLGGEIEGWLRNSNTDQGRPGDEMMLAYSVVTYWYPSRRYLYYLKGGLGMVTYRIDDGTDRLTSSALGPQVGAGWELPVGAHFSFIPYVNLLFASTGAEIKFNGSPFLDNASLELFQIGLGLARR